MIEEEIPVAQEITACEYIDLWWQKVSQQPAESFSAEGGLLTVVVGVLIWLYRRSKTRTSSGP